MSSGFNLFKNWIEISIPDSDGFIPISVAGLVPNNATGVILRISNQTMSAKTCVRRPGSTLDPSWFQLGWKKHVFAFCGLVDLQFESYIKTKGTTPETKVLLCGYTDEAVTFLPDLVQTTDASQIVPADATGGIWLIYNEWSSGNPFAIWGYGSTDRHYGPTDPEIYGLHATHIVPGGGEADSFVYALVAFGEGKKIGFKSGYGGKYLKPYLLGYTRPPVHFFLNCIEKLPTVQDKWETISVPEVPAEADGVIVEMRSSSPGMRPLGIRAPGSINSEDFSFLGLETAKWGVCGLSDNKFEAYNEFRAYQPRDGEELPRSFFFIHGYTVPEGTPPEFPCPYCSEVFPTQEGLNQHILDEHTFPCPYCSESFISQEDLDAHIASQHNFPCPHCSESFTSQDDLDAHIQDAHTFTCPHCGEVFHTQEELDDHIALEHHFVCPYCEQVFSSQAELDAHIQESHNFPCPYCDEVFGSQAELDAHIAESHPQQPFTINITSGYVKGSKKVTGNQIVLDITNGHIEGEIETV